MEKMVLLRITSTNILLAETLLLKGKEASTILLMAFPRKLRRFSWMDDAKKKDKKNLGSHKRLVEAHGADVQLRMQIQVLVLPYFFQQYSKKENVPVVLLMNVIYSLLPTNPEGRFGLFMMIEQINAIDIEGWT
ncbi:hypothetical protein Tco_0126487 [Tanacetum coccineum]